MTLKELKDKLATIPKDFDEYEVGGMLSDYEIECPFKDMDVTIFMNTKQISLIIKR